MTPTTMPEPAVFAALGDSTRLALLSRLRGGEAMSIASLREGTPLTRQAITKHLKVLSSAGLVRDARRGREHLWSLDARPMRDLALWAESWRAEWEGRFDRLERYLEANPEPRERP